MRIALGMRFFDGPFSDIFPAAPLPKMLKARMGQVELLKPQPIAELSDLMDATIKKWHCRPRLSVFPAPSNPDRCSDEALLLCARMAERHHTGIHTHLLETKKQAELARARYGTTMVRHLEELGVLSDRWSCAHSIWLTDDDIELMAARKAIAVLNPESNDRLREQVWREPGPAPTGSAAGVGDRRFRRERQPHHARGDARGRCGASFKRTRPISLDHRRRRPAHGDGRRAAALRHQKLGKIGPGFAADLVVYRLDAPWWMPVNDIVNQMVFAETGASVETVLIDGQVVVANGVITTFDVDALLREVQSMSRSLRERNADLFDVAHGIAEFVP